MSWPIDLNFTTIVDYPGTPNLVDATDINRWSQGIANLANPPSAAMGRQDTTSVSSSLTFNRLLWKTTIFSTDSSIIRANSTGSPGTSSYQADRLFLPYPAEWWISCVIRTTSSTSVGYGQLKLSAVFSDGTADGVQDTDTGANNSSYDTVLRCNCSIVVGAAQISSGVAIAADYAQNSGSPTTVATTYPAYPRIQVRAVGKGGQA